MDHNLFKCVHCNSPIQLDSPFDQKLENGVAYAQVCKNCNHKIGIRPRLESDPEPEPSIFVEKELNKLNFVKYRLGLDIIRQTQLRWEDECLEETRENNE